jgi:hypothetical protein
MEQVTPRQCPLKVMLFPSSSRALLNLQYVRGEIFVIDSILGTQLQESGFPPLARPKILPLDPFAHRSKDDSVIFKNL